VFEYRKEGQNMKDSTTTTASASDVFAGDLKISHFHARAWHRASTGNPHSMRIFRVFETSQSAASCESYLEDISKTRPHTTGEFMEIN
jgi:hypothetical protein